MKVPLRHAFLRMIRKFNRCKLTVIGMLLSKDRSNCILTAIYMQYNLKLVELILGLTCQSKVVLCPASVSQYYYT